jgi:protein TonB
MFTFVGQNETVRRRGALVIAISLGLHLAALSALLGAQLWSVPPIREPQVNSVLVLLGQLPVPPGGGQTAVRKEIKKDTSAKQPPLPRTPIHQPDPETVPSKVPADPPPQNASDSVDPNADPLAPAGPGLPPGDGPGPPGPTSGPAGPAGPIDDAPIMVDGSVVKPQLIPESKVQPRYTEIARKARLQGMVVLEAIIDERGNVVNVRVLRGLPMGLTDEAMAAVSQWKFRPATLAGRPVKVYFSLRVDFLVH